MNDQNRQRPREDGAQQPNAAAIPTTIPPALLTDDEVDRLFASASHWIESGDQTGFMRDLHNLAHTARQLRAQHAKRSEGQLENARAIRAMFREYDPTRQNMNPLEAMREALSELARLRLVNAEHVRVMFKVHRAIEKFESGFGVRPAWNSDSAQRIGALQTLTEQVAAERDHFAELFTQIGRVAIDRDFAALKGDGFERRSAGYVAMYLGEQDRYESFGLPLHVRARTYLSDIRARLAEANSLREELRATSKLRDHVGQNFDDLHAGALEALTNAYGGDRHRAWLELDAAYAEELRVREAGGKNPTTARTSPLTPLGGAQEAQPLPRAANARPAQTAGTQDTSQEGFGDAFAYVEPPRGSVFDRLNTDTAAKFAARAFGDGRTENYGAAYEHTFHGAPRAREDEPIQIGEMTSDRARQVAEEYMRRHSEICHAAFTDESTGRVVDLQPMSADCDHVLVDGEILPRRVADERSPRSVVVMGATREAFDALLRLDSSLIREAKRRSLPHETALVALGAILSRLDSLAELEANCSEVHARAHETLDRLGAEKGGVRTSGNLSERIRQLDATLRERIEQGDGGDALASLEEIGSFLVSRGVNVTRVPPLTSYGEAIAQLVRLAISDLDGELSQARDAAANNLARADHELSQRRQAERERDARAQAVCRATGAQTFGAAIAEVNRLAKLEKDALHQLTILLSVHSPARGVNGVLNLIAVLGDAWREEVAIRNTLAERARENFDRGNRLESQLQQAHVVLNRRGVPNDGGRQTVAERLAAYIVVIDEANGSVSDQLAAILRQLRVSTYAEARDAIARLREVEQENDGLRVEIETCHATLTDKGIGARDSALRYRVSICANSSALSDNRMSMITAAHHALTRRAPSNLHNGKLLPERIDAVFAEIQARELRLAEVVATVFGACSESFERNEHGARLFAAWIKAADDRINELETECASLTGRLRDAEDYADDRLKGLQRIQRALNAAGYMPSHVPHNLTFGEIVAIQTETVVEYLREEIARHVRTIADADAVVRAQEVPPADGVRIEVADTLAQKIVVLMDVRAAHIDVLCRQSQEARDILKAIAGMPLNLPLVEMCRRASTFAHGGNVYLFAELAARALFDSFGSIEAQDGAKSRMLNANDIEVIVRDFAFGNSPNLPERLRVNFTDCRAIARDIQRRFVVLKTASVMHADEGVDDETFARELFTMFNPQPVRDAGEEGDEEGRR